MLTIFCPFFPIHIICGSEWMEHFNYDTIKFAGPELMAVVMIVFGVPSTPTSS